MSNLCVKVLNASILLKTNGSAVELYQGSITLSVGSVNEMHVIFNATMTIQQLLTKTLSGEYAPGLLNCYFIESS